MSESNRKTDGILGEENIINSFHSSIYCHPNSPPFCVNGIHTTYVHLVKLFYIQYIRTE